MSGDNNNYDVGLDSFSSDQSVTTKSNNERNPGGSTGGRTTTTNTDGSQHTTEWYQSSGGWSSRHSWDTDANGERSNDHYSVNGQKRKDGKYK